MAGKDPWWEGSVAKRDPWWEGSMVGRIREPTRSRRVQTSASHREMVPLQLLMGFVPAGRSSSAISSFASDSLM